ncbi:hypothetical protein F2Q69_00052737 [Brassica cretica]|uniref:Uncharacterized protein n=1 Tax=Brassica cretica TaxID=69181 RepID=A0A8S9N0G4_BRACR|nr:hypothetical protein F2Q69_00052737 [Brassica cretica]
MDEMRQDIVKIQHAADRHRPASIDIHYSTSIADDPNNSHPLKSEPDFNTRAEIDQLVEEIYRTLATIEERLDMRCDDIYFPMDLSMSSLTSKIEAIQRELVEIQSYIARRPEASASIDRRNNKSTNIQRQTSVDDATNQGRLLPKVTSDMSDTHNHGEEISADTYATLMRHQFNIESLRDRLKKIENTTATMKEKWRRGDEAMRDFTGRRPSQHGSPFPWARMTHTEVTSPMGEDDPHQGHLAHGRGRPAPMSPPPWARTTRTEVTSPMGEDDLRQGHLAHGRGPTSYPETVHPCLSSRSTILGPLDAIPMSRLT